MIWLTVLIGADGGGLGGHPISHRGAGKHPHTVLRPLGEPL